MVATAYTNCNLFIPHKDYLFGLPDLEVDSDGKVDTQSLQAFNEAKKRLAKMQFTNYKRLEEWANKIGPMICDCDCGGGGGG